MDQNKLIASTVDEIISAVEMLANLTGKCPQTILRDMVEIFDEEVGKCFDK